MIPEIKGNGKSAMVNDLLQFISSNPNMGMEELLAFLFNNVMSVERDVVIDESDDDENKANGYYKRGLNLGNMKLKLDVPRDRNGDFRSQLLPDKWQRGDERYKELLISLVETGYSENRIKRVLRKLGLSYNEKSMKKIKDELKKEMDAFKKRELNSEYFAMFIDAYETRIRHDNQVKKAQVYVILGISLDGNKELLSVKVHFGSEKKSVWLKIFRDLISRGLEAVAVIISDDFSGIRNAVNEIFPDSNHQLCYVHLMRNIRRNLSRDDSKDFTKVLKEIKDHSVNYEDGKHKFTKLLEKYKDKYPNYMKYLLDRMPNYLNFLKYPEKIRKFFYTTNIVESFNSMLEKVRYENGWHFQSVEFLEMNILLVYKHLKNNKWKNPIPRIKAYQYQLNRIFKIQFEEKL
jgi:transposase-like protein